MTGRIEKTMKAKVSKSKQGTKSSAAGAIATAAAISSPSAKGAREAGHEELTRLIDMALAEDISTGDITADAIVPEQSTSTASLVLKQPGVIAGLRVFEMVMKRCDAELSFEARVADSEQVLHVPYCLARMEGNSRAMLAAERTALNLIQRMSGIATMTRKYVDLAREHGIEILDTRKTTPGLRVLEKMAVKSGGGTNHRFGLYDQILIKDNHRAIAGGVRPAIMRARLNNPDLPIEIEVNTLEQLEEALGLSVERIMLDNMSPEEVKQAVEIAAGRTYIEVSGGISLETIENYLIAGVNGISVGALTHSVKNIDISLEFEE